MRHRCCIFFSFLLLWSTATLTQFYTQLSRFDGLPWTKVHLQLHQILGEVTAQLQLPSSAKVPWRPPLREPRSVDLSAMGQLWTSWIIMTYSYHNMTNWYLFGRSIFIHESSIFIALCHTALCHLPWFPPWNAPPASGWMGRSPKTCQTSKNHLEKFPGDPKTQENWVLWFPQKAFKDWYFEEFWGIFRLTTSRLTCAPRGRTSNSLRWQLRPSSRSIDCSCRRTWEAPNFGTWEV